MTDQPIRATDKGVRRALRPTVSAGSVPGDRKRSCDRSAGAARSNRYVPAPLTAIRCMRLETGWIRSNTITPEQGTREAAEAITRLPA